LRHFEQAPGLYPRSAASASDSNDSKVISVFSKLLPLEMKYTPRSRNSAIADLFFSECSPNRPIEKS
jgi:hypothetical protein